MFELEDVKGRLLIFVWKDVRGREQGKGGMSSETWRKDLGRSRKRE